MVLHVGAAQVFGVIAVTVLVILSYFSGIVRARSGVLRVLRDMEDEGYIVRCFVEVTHEPSKEEDSNG